MAGALGFADSHAPGFWEALTQAVADQRTQAEEREKASAEQAAAERAAQANQVILDAATYGRRTVVTVRAADVVHGVHPPGLRRHHRRHGQHPHGQRGSPPGRLEHHHHEVLQATQHRCDRCRGHGGQGRRRDRHEGDRVRAGVDRRQGGRQPSGPAARAPPPRARSRTRSIRRPTAATDRRAAASRTAAPSSRSRKRRSMRPSSATRPATTAARISTRSSCLTAARSPRSSRRSCRALPRSWKGRCRSEADTRSSTRTGTTRSRRSPSTSTQRARSPASSRK